MYGGSFVHVTPSFVIPEVVYVDSDRRAAKFFTDPGVKALVKRRKEYEEEPIIRFHAQSYEKPLAEDDESIDLLISQYSGFVSRACKRYLKVGGHLVANNSHGDASMAKFDPDFELVAVYKRRGDRYTITSKDLESYMIEKRQPAPTREELECSMKGPGFTKQASGYIFERVR